MPGRLPDFLVIGAEKSGTTSLDRYLNQHPGIYMSPLKEPRFFALEGHKLDFDGPGDQTAAVQRSSVTTLDEYRALFCEASGEQAVGETSPIYLYLPEAADRIRRYVPEAKVIAVLRNPVDRAYSAYLHKVREGRETLGFAEALEREEARLQSNWAPGWAYKRIGFYHAQLARYHQRLPRSQIRIYLYEDLRAGPLGVLQDIYRFLGVDDAFVADTSRRYNVAGRPRNRALLTLLERPNPVKNILGPLLPQGLSRPVATRLRSWNLAAPPPLAPEVRRELVSLYREDVLRLQELIGRDLSGWLGEEA
jgi:hypothetical protein